MKTQRMLFLIAFYVFMAMWTTRAAFFAEQDGIDLLLAICIAMCATLACIADSRIVGRPMSHAAKWVMLFLWPFAIPIYMIWSRGWRGVKWIATHLGITAAILLGFTWFLVGVLGVEPK